MQDISVFTDGGGVLHVTEYEDWLTVLDVCPASLNRTVDDDTFLHSMGTDSVYPSHCWLWDPGLDANNLNKI